MSILNTCWNLYRTRPISVIITLIISEFPKCFFLPIGCINQYCIMSWSWCSLINLLSYQKVIKILRNYPIWYHNTIIILCFCKEFIIYSFIYHDIGKFRRFNIISFLYYLLHNIDFILYQFFNLSITYSISKYNNWFW